MRVLNASIIHLISGPGKSGGAGAKKIKFKRKETKRQKIEGTLALGDHFFECVSSFVKRGTVRQKGCWIQMGKALSLH